MGQSQTKQVSGELERLLLELRRELVEEEGETAVDIVVRLSKCTLPFTIENPFSRPNSTITIPSSPSLQH